MKRIRDVRVLLGGGALGGSVLVLAASLSGALSSSPARDAVGAPAAVEAASTSAMGAATDPAPVATAAEGAVMPVAVALEPDPEDGVIEAAGKAPFDPRRQAPRGRYRLPEEFVVEEPPPPPPPPPPAPDFRVLGTIGGPGGGVAVIEVNGEPPRVVSVGEDVLGYNLSAIGDRRVVVSKDGRNVSVAMVDASPAVVSNAPAAGRGQAGRGGRGGAAGRGQGAPFTVDVNGVPVDLGQRVQQLQDRLQRAQEQNQGRANQGGNQTRPNQGRGGGQNQRPTPRPPGGG